MSFRERLQHGWNAFRNRDPTPLLGYNSDTYHYKPDRVRLNGINGRTILSAIYNKIALDCASIDIKHCRLDDQGRYLNELDTQLNRCLNVSSNLDQTPRTLKQDIVMSMFDEGVVAVLPIDTTIDPRVSGGFDIESIRTGRIIEWKPSSIKVKVYNEKTGKKQDIWVPKSSTVIVENPFFAVMNEPNSIVQRLIRKMNLLDVIDEQSGSGKLDLLVQLPYAVKGEYKKKQAEERRIAIEKQLYGSKYGIAYIDSTEHVTQLNRPVENNLMKQIEYLTTLLFTQMGLTEGILNGSASDAEMSNYYTRIIEVIISTIVEEMRRKWLTKTARSQKQSIEYFRDPFKLIPIDKIANVADTFTRNEILTSNEFRQIIGRTPSSDPRADQLINSNLNHDPSEYAEGGEEEEVPYDETMQEEE